MADRLGEAVLDLRTDDRHLDSGLRRAELRSKKLERTFRDTTRAIGRHFRTMSIIGVAAATALSAAVVKASNSYKQLEGQLRVVEQTQKAATERFEELHALANETRGSLDGTVTVYTRLARANRQFGASQSELLAFTKTLNQAIAVSGASAEEARAAMIQFAQGMASGELRGEELRSVMEQLPRLAIAIADGLGIEGVGALREMAEQGELTAERVFRAVQDQQDVIAREFEQLPRRVDQALTQLGNDMLKAFGTADVSGLVEAIDDFRDIVTDPEFVAAVMSLAEATFNFLGGTAQLIKDVHQFWREYEEGVSRTEARNAVLEQAEHVQTLTDRLRRLRQELGHDFPGDRPISILGGQTLNQLERERDLQLEILKTLERQRKFVEGTARLGIREAGGFTAAERARRTAAPTQAPSDPARFFAGPAEAGNLTIEQMEIIWNRQQRAAEDAGDAIAGVQADLTENQRELNRAAQDTGFAFRSAFADAVVEGERLHDVLRALGKDLAQILFRATAGRALSGAVENAVLGALSGGSGGASLGIREAGGFGGARARGGPVTAGRSYLVGERGAEIFHPDRSGHVSPNASGVTIEYADLRGASVEAVTRLEQMLDQLNGSIEDRAVGAVADDYLRGGTMRGVLR